MQNILTITTKSYNIMRAHRFQEKYTGVQIYVWHSMNEDQARSEFRRTVINPDNWVYLGEVTV